MLTASGTLHSQDRRSLPPLFTQYYRTELHQLVSPSMGQELLTINQTRIYYCVAWTVARQMELVSADSVGLSQDAESAEAARMAQEEMRNRLATQRPYNIQVGKEMGARAQIDPIYLRRRKEETKERKEQGKRKDKQ